MGADQTQVDSQKKTSKYSFREFWLPAIGSAILIKLIGPLPGVVAFITFVWLKPKLGILMAIAFPLLPPLLQQRCSSLAYP